MGSLLCRNALCEPGVKRITSVRHCQKKKLHTTPTRIVSPADQMGVMGCHCATAKAIVQTTPHASTLISHAFKMYRAGRAACWMSFKAACASSRDRLMGTCAFIENSVL